MQTAIIATKIRIPPSRPHSISRPRLLARLQEGPMFVRPGNLTYEFYGDLEGTFVENITMRAPLLTFDGHYTVEGQATFVGMLNGKRASWAGSVEGGGFIDPAYGGTAGWESCVTTITSSASPLLHMRGTIASTGTWDPTGGSASYSGLLTWDTGQTD